MKYFSNKKGFTLVELLVVIAIIGILTAIVTANFTQAKAKARDAKRISDLAQIQLTLEMIFDKCGTYPAAYTSNVISNSQLGDPIDSARCPGMTLNSFISKIPQESATVSYDYIITNTGTPRYDYILGAQLETDSSVFQDSFSSGSIGTKNCGAAAKYYCVVPK
jgi:prepilin-type N-terminal cleavage/methylation domain-containing protein